MFTNKLNNFINFLFKKKRNDSDIESAKGEVISLGKRAGLGYEERIMLNNVLRFSVLVNVIRLAIRSSPGVICD